MVETAVAPKSKTSTFFAPSRLFNLSLRRSSICHMVLSLLKRSTQFMVMVASAGRLPLPRLSTPASVPKATELFLAQDCFCNHSRKGTIFFSALFTVSFELKAICALIIPVSIGGMASLPMVGIILLTLTISNTITPAVNSERLNTRCPVLENLITLT